MWLLSVDCRTEWESVRKEATVNLFPGAVSLLRTHLQLHAFQRDEWEDEVRSMSKKVVDISQVIPPEYTY
jgi:hypothetical protein